MGFKVSEAIKESKVPLTSPGHFIGGAFEPGEAGGLCKAILNPSSGEEICTIRLSRAQVLKAIDIGSQHARDFARTPLEERFQVVEQFRTSLVDQEEAIVRALQIGCGKPRWEAVHEFGAALGFLDELLLLKDQLPEVLVNAIRPLAKGTRISRLPQGLTVAHIPFSASCSTFIKFFSLSMIAGGPFIAIGSAHAGLLTFVMAEILAHLGLHPGAAQVLTGNFEMFRMASSDKRVRAFHYRGSREHCLTLRQEASELLDRAAILQSGGKNAVLVHSSANLEEAVASVLFGGLKSAGQLCTSTSRVFVPTEMLSEFVDGLVEGVRQLSIAPTTGDENPQMGPLYSQKARDKFLRFQTMAKREARQTVLWGKALDIQRGFFVSPGVHIMKDLDSKSAYQSNVLLFPDLAIYEYQDIKEGVAMVNETNAQLVTSILARDTDWIEQWDFRTPNLLLNKPSCEMDAYLPVAGRGLCGSVDHNGIGILNYLTYPVSLVIGDGAESIGWPTASATEL